MSDLISREWLKTAIHNFYYGLKHTPTEEDIQAYIDAAPSVSAEKIGHWKKLSVGYGCSECSLCTNKNGIDFYIYCPNCGARMENLEHIDKTGEYLLMRYAELIDSENDPRTNYDEVVEEKRQVCEEILRRMKGGD